MECCAAVICCLALCQGDTTVQAGFAEVDITPKLNGKPVYLAGFGHNRKATAVHDPIMVRAAVLSFGNDKIAIVSVDVVGLFLPMVEKVRKQLPGFKYVLVSSTHNHEGPDTLGLWGANPFQSGVDPDYMKRVEEGIALAVKNADKAKRSANDVHIGTANDPDLLHDGRLPIVKHDELVALRFGNTKEKPLGLIVQWNNHPETLGSKNTEISADYVASTVEHLQKKHGCPVVYLTGTVGGLMTSLRVPVKDDAGKSLEDGTFEKAIRYGRMVGELADKALAKSKPIKLTPFEVRSREIFLPLDNKLYVLGWQTGVLSREGFLWTGDVYKGAPIADAGEKKRYCMRTEIARLKLGELEIACIPGEIYPELVLDKVVDPPEAGADFPDAPVEPAIYKQLKSPYRMIVGLANDEIGYIIPKRQWDEKAPYCYGRKTSQYGEVNSLGVETAPLLCEAFRKLVNEK